MSTSDAFGQGRYQVRFDVGIDGARRILPGAHVAVVVDALSFTTAAVAAAEHGVPVVPAALHDDTAAVAAQFGGVVAGRRGEAGPTLSPTSFAAAERGVPVVLASPNGGALTAALAEQTDPDGGPLVVLAAAFRNRAAVARRILQLQEERGSRLFVAIVAAGETDELRTARPAIEDQLAAGGVVEALVGLGIDHTSPEAAVASAAFEGLRHALKHLVGAGGSGAELTALGYRDDVRFALELDVADVVPELRDGALRG